MSVEAHFETQCLPLNAVLKLSLLDLFLNCWASHRGPGFGSSCL